MILRKYNAAATIVFPLYLADGSALTTAASFATGDVKIIKNEGVPGNTTNLPVHEGNGLYSLALTATEMQAARVGILIDDQTASELWLGVGLVIETFGDASAQLVQDLNATYLPADVRQWNGAAVPEDVTGKPSVNLTHVDAAALASHGSGLVPSDVNKIQNQTLVSHLSGAFPADIVALLADSTAAGYLRTASRQAEQASVTTQISATEFSATGVAATTDDNYIDRLGVFLHDTITLALRGRIFYVTDFVGSGKTFTVDLLPATPVVGDTFILL